MKSSQIVVAVVEYDRLTDDVTQDYLHDVVARAIDRAYPGDRTPRITVRVMEGAKL